MRQVADEMLDPHNRTIGMSTSDAERRHTDIYLAGFRARAAAVGLTQLIVELRQSGALGDDAVDRIRDAVADELTVSRPIGMPADQFRHDIQSRLDRLLHRDQMPERENAPDAHGLAQAGAHERAG